jgi:hypothetical protein
LSPHDTTCNKLSNMATLWVPAWNFSTHSKGYWAEAHTTLSIAVISPSWDNISGLALHRTEYWNRAKRQKNISVMAKNVYFLVLLFQMIVRTQLVFHALHFLATWSTVPRAAVFTSTSLAMAMQCLLAKNVNGITKLTSVTWVRERTILTKRPLVGDVSANFCGERVPHGQHDGSLQPYSQLSRSELLLFLPSSSSVVLMRLSGPRSRPTTSQKIW